MNPWLQNLIVLLIAAGALVYLARRGWLAVAGRKSSGCGSCGSCPTQSTSSKSDGFVPLDSLRKHPR